MSGKIIIFFQFCVFSLHCKKVDLTREDYATGKDVVDEVDERLRFLDNKIYPDDKKFCKRAAKMESNYGRSGNCFKKGGIWRLGKDRFEMTKDIVKYPGLIKGHEEIQRVFGIDWPNCEWEYLLKPLYSALGFRLYFFLLEITFQGTLKWQKELWELYNNNTDPDKSFEEEIPYSENEQKCNAKADIVFVLDSSGSMSVENFNKQCESIKKIVEAISNEEEDEIKGLKIGIVQFSTDAKVVLILGYYTYSVIESVLDGLIHDKGRTNTCAGLEMAKDELCKENDENETGNKIIYVFTDGKTNECTKEELESKVKAAVDCNCQIYAAGIGEIDINDLLIIANNNPNYVRDLNDFYELLESIFHLAEDICKEPQKPEMGETVSDSVSVNEKRYYVFPKNSSENQRFMVDLDLYDGAVRGFYSFTDPTPSSASNDGSLNIPGTNEIDIPKNSKSKIISPQNEIEEEEEFLAIVIEGLDANKNWNKYEISVSSKNYEINDSSSGMIIISKIPANIYILFSLSIYIFY